MDDIVAKEGFGYKFDPKACQECKGNCCIGESGYIWMSKNEINNLAKYLNLPYEEIIERFLVKIGYRYSIKERVYKDGYACIFFNEKFCRCGIYGARPIQCRTFPFWNYFKNKEEEVRQECPGIIS